VVVGRGAAGPPRAPPPVDKTYLGED
jgi:hypothetical protein